MQSAYQERLPYIIVRHARQNATAKQGRLDDERAREVLRQESAIGEDGVVVGVVGDEEAQVLEEAEQDQPETAPRKFRRNNRNAGPMYALLYYIFVFPSMHSRECILMRLHMALVVCYA